MGLRSWLTPVYSKADLDKVITYVDDDDEGRCLVYIIQISKQGTPFSVGDVLVAWLSDGSSSLDCLKPSYCRRSTAYLDNILDDFPRWHTGKKGPEKFGSYIKYPETEPDWSIVSLPEYELIDSDSQMTTFRCETWCLYEKYIGGIGYGEDDEVKFTLKDIDGSIYTIHIFWDDEVVIKYLDKELNITYEVLISYLDNLPDKSLIDFFRIKEW